MIFDHFLYTTMYAVNMGPLLIHVTQHSVALLAAPIMLHSSQFGITGQVRYLAKYQMGLKMFTLAQFQ